MTLQLDEISENKLNKALALTLRRYAVDPLAMENATVFALKAWIKLAADNDPVFFDCLTQFDSADEREAFLLHTGSKAVQAPPDTVSNVRAGLRLIDGGLADET